MPPILNNPTFNVDLAPAERGVAPGFPGSLFNKTHHPRMNPQPPERHEPRRQSGKPLHHRINSHVNANSEFVRLASQALRARFNYDSVRERNNFFLNHQSVRHRQFLGKMRALQKMEKNTLAKLINNPQGKKLLPRY
jgi:hypothetical protein